MYSLLIRLIRILRWRRDRVRGGDGQHFSSSDTTLISRSIYLSHLLWTAYLPTFLGVSRCSMARVPRASTTNWVYGDRQTYRVEGESVDWDGAPDIHNGPTLNSISQMAR